MLPPCLQLLLPWRSYHDLTHAPELLLLKKGGPGVAVALVVQVHAGKVLQQLELPAAGVTQVGDCLGGNGGLGCLGDAHS